MNRLGRWWAPARGTDGECESARLEHERDRTLDESGPPEEAGDVVTSLIATRGTRVDAERRSPEGIDGSVALEHERVLRALRMTRARRLAIALGSSGQGTRAR